MNDTHVYFLDSGRPRNVVREQVCKNRLAERNREPPEEKEAEMMFVSGGARDSLNSRNSQKWYPHHVFQKASQLEIQRAGLISRGEGEGGEVTHERFLAKPIFEECVSDVA